MKNKRFLQAMRRTCSVLLYAVMLVLLLIGLYPILAKHLLGAEHPSLFGYSSAVVISGSMSGSIEVNDIVIIHEKSVYETDDIISFESDGALVTHRIIAQEQGEFITKGDANDTADPDSVSPEQIVGKVVLVIPKLGAVIYFFKTPAGMAVLFLAAALLVILPACKQQETNGGAVDEKE